MNNKEIVFIENGKVVTNSLMVAEETEKEHRNVIRDVREIIEKMEDKKWGLLNFEQSTYRNNQGKEQPMYVMTEEGFTLLAMGYNGSKFINFKVKYIQEFRRMKEQLQGLHIPSYIIEDPIKRAERWIEEQKQKKLVEQKLQLAEPVVKDFNDIIATTNGVSISAIAKQYGLSAVKLNKILHEKKVQYKSGKQWLLYKEHDNQGYTEADTILYTDESGENKAKMHTKWTQKGRVFIHKLLDGMGIKKVVDDSELLLTM